MVNGLTGPLGVIAQNLATLDNKFVLERVPIHPPKTAGDIVPVQNGEKDIVICRHALFQV